MKASKQKSILSKGTFLTPVIALTVFLGLCQLHDTSIAFSNELSTFQLHLF